MMSLEVVNEMLPKYIIRAVVTTIKHEYMVNSKVINWDRLQD